MVKEERALLCLKTRLMRLSLYWDKTISSLSCNELMQKTWDISWSPDMAPLLSYWLLWFGQLPTWRALNLGNHPSMHRMAHIQTLLYTNSKFSLELHNYWSGEFPGLLLWSTKETWMGNSPRDVGRTIMMTCKWKLSLAMRQATVDCYCSKANIL